MRRRRYERSMRSELGDFVCFHLFLNLSHEVNCINGNLLIEYDLCSRVGKRSQNGSYCSNKTTMHNSVSRYQRSYSGLWVDSCPTTNGTYAPVYSVSPTISLTVRSIRTTTSTTHYTSYWVYVLITRVRAQCVCTWPWYTCVLLLISIKLYFYLLEARWGQMSSSSIVLMAGYAVRNVASVQIAAADEQLQINMVMQLTTMTKNSLFQLHHFFIRK